MGYVLSKAASHFCVACSTCAATIELCPKRAEPSVFRAAAAFREAGWHLDASHAVKMGDHHSHYEYGTGTWHCPACASKRP